MQILIIKKKEQKTKRSGKEITTSAKDQQQLKKNI